MNVVDLKFGNIKKFIFILLVSISAYSQTYIDESIGLTLNETAFTEIRVGTKIDTPISISAGIIAVWDYKKLTGDIDINPKFSIVSHLNNEMRISAGIQTDLYRPSDKQRVNILNTNVKILPNFSVNIPLYRRYPIGYGIKYVEYTPEIYISYDTKNILIGLNLNINNL